ncbi:Transglycosylase-like domain-containing protein [Nakamurella panacisegetis]|uniref:Transglycosylase-like domain-containing protein n=1 Tax=Nakamurella panacisegetis TaxID=1090615 RepID=A0A1H0JTB2_9ACTN|nr:transglycosylase family protein [Nakamurella panacisegetis]SDO46779.1 Transglycosylase-like domain-containing protein [Nakamurella panacisegetis]
MRRALALGTTIAALFAGMTIFMAGSASADPSASDWASLRQCESSGDYSINTGNGYYGAYQFDQSTWNSVGGSGSPADASPSEQDYRALYLYRMRGWSPWTCASLAGLREDSMASSGVVPSRADSAYISGGGTSTYTPVPTNSCNIGKSTAPAWGGTTFSRGTTYRGLVCWQKQMATKGYHFTGTGYFGAYTLSVVHQLQSTSGIRQSDVIDASTWAAAWGRAATTPTKPSEPTKPTKPVTPTKPTKPVTPTKPTKPVTPTKPVSGALWPGITAASCHVGARKAPAWPKESFALGDYDKALACWQMQMGRRGYDLIGVGYYGDHTLAAAKSIQNANHLGGTGLIGPKTWKAAWEGKVKP